MNREDQVSHLEAIILRFPKGKIFRCKNIYPYIREGAFVCNTQAAQVFTYHVAPCLIKRGEIRFIEKSSRGAAYKRV